MRLALIAVATSLALGCLAGPVAAQCDDKSQQNAADEAAVRGDLAAASTCAGPSDTARSEQKLEDAATRAKRKTDGKIEADGRSSGASAQGDRGENPGAR